MSRIYHDVSISFKVLRNGSKYNSNIPTKLFSSRGLGRVHAFESPLLLHGQPHLALHKSLCLCHIHHRPIDNVAFIPTSDPQKCHTTLSSCSGICFNHDYKGIQVLIANCGRESAGFASMLRVSFPICLS